MSRCSRNTRCSISPGCSTKSVALLAQQEEFARSRLKLQARYHHVLVDEFQDTSRLQWRLVELLVDAWGEGEGISDAPTSIFIVGDRKQSIYRFRHAEVTLLDDAAQEDLGAAARPHRAPGDYVQLPRCSGTAGLRQRTGRVDGERRRVAREVHVHGPRSVSGARD